MSTPIFPPDELQTQQKREIIAQALAPYAHSGTSDAEKLRILADVDELYCRNLRTILKQRSTVYVHANSTYAVGVPFEVVESWLQEKLQTVEHRLAVFTEKIQELENPPHAND